MKRLLLICLFSGSLDGFSQVFNLEDTSNVRLVTGIMALPDPPKPDTLASHLLISHHPPSFAHSVEGYCITVNGWCTGKHLVYRSRHRWIFGRKTWAYKVIGRDYDVWRCNRKEGGL